MNNIIKTLLTSILLGSAINVAYAETAYVTENLSTYLRRGAGDNFKIAGAIQSGEAVTILERQERYSLVRDSKNREAWILNSDLSNTPSSKIEPPKLRAQVQELTLKLNKIDDDWKLRTAELQRRSDESNQKSSQLLGENAQLKRELEITKNKNRDLESMLDAGKREIAIQWFIYGGTVLGIGLLLGLILPVIMPKRRRNNDGWS